MSNYLPQSGSDLPLSHGEPVCFAKKKGGTVMRYVTGFT